VTLVTSRSLALRFSPATVALALALSVTADGASPAPSKTSKAAHPRELKRRALKITDDRAEAIPEIHVSAGTPTTLAFQIAVKENGVLLSDPREEFFPPQFIDRAVIVVPKKDLAANEVRSLTVSLSDGTLLPFKLVTVPADVDLQVDVEVALEKKAPPASATALKGTVAELQGKLDECQATAGTAGVAKIASLVRAQGFAKPESFVVERRPIHRLDKESRLLVEARLLYRLFGHAYLVLTVENRDPARVWVLDRAEVAVKGGAADGNVKVLALSAEVTSLPPGETEAVVVAFAMPAQTAGETLSLSLIEKGGSRNVVLDDLAL
jgi:uncharacterized protein (TIGR02268 family)